MSLKSQAAAKLEELLPEGVALESHWKTAMTFLKQQQTVCLFRFERDGVPHIGAVAERSAPWTVAVPNWDEARKGRREREWDVLYLYLGWSIYALRDRGEPDAKMLERAERARASALKHRQATAVEVLEVVRIKGYGGIHVLMKRELVSSGGSTWSELINHEERILLASHKVLSAVVAHPTWYFIGQSQILP